MMKLRSKSRIGDRHARHIILFAKNQVGLRNLYHLISDSNLKYFKRYPIIPKTELVTHREGLIIGSACEAGELFRAVADHKDWAELRRIASFYDYLEIQPICNNMFMLRNGTVQSEEELRELNRTIVRLGRELGKPVCATGDVHFQEPEDEVYRHILLASKKFADADAPLPIYFKTTEEMLEEFAYLGQEEAHRVVIDDPRSIADRIEEIELLPPGRLFPPRLENSEQELHDKVWNKCHELYGDEPPQLVVDRLNVELKSILGKYDVVYMSAQKLVQRSLENGYLVGSRGSVGSSLVAYMSGITEVNSLPPHYRCPKCRHTEFVTDGSYGCGADMPDKVCPKCGAKLRKDGTAAECVCTFLLTNRFREDQPQDYPDAVIRLDVPGNSTPEIVGAALDALRLIWKPGFEYKKAGVTVFGIVRESEIQGTLFGFDDGLRLRRDKISEVMDKVNVSGRNVLRMATQRPGHYADGIRKEHCSRPFSTSWNDILEVH